MATIARQLASLPVLGERICESIQHHRDICNQSLTDQWHHLITKPLSEADDKSCSFFFVIVIDALDECDNDDDIMTILWLLGETQSTYNQLRIFLTSRPEIPVRRVFYRIRENRRQNLVLHEIIPETINDLTIFFNKKLAEIAKNHDFCANWPGRKVVQQLVKNAGGLFIWAATACRFIDDSKQFANDRLSTILQCKNNGSEPQKHLDHIYITVFSHSISVNYSEVEKGTIYGLLKYVLGIIVILSSQLPVDSVATLLGITSQDILGTVKNLHAILAVPDNFSSSLRLHHPSLRDFLLDSERCTDPDLYIDEKQAHRQILIRCIRLMSIALKKDICGLTSPGFLRRDIPNHQVEQCLPPELQYACLYWVQHLIKSGTLLYHIDFIHHFLKTHLLHWLEALSLMEKVTEGILAINSLLSHALV